MLNPNVIIAIAKSLEDGVKEKVEKLIKQNFVMKAGRLLVLIKAFRALKHSEERNYSIKKQGALHSSTLEDIEAELKLLVVNVPNRIHFSTPLRSMTVKTWGVRRVWSAQKPDHSTIGKLLGLDAEGGARMSGAGFSVLRGQLSSLNRTLVQFMLDLHSAEHHYEEYHVPLLIKEQLLYLSGHLPKFKNEMFSVLDGAQRLFLIPTSEVMFANYLGASVVAGHCLPQRMVTCSTCFRQESSCYGKTNRNLLRQRQFDKVELFRIVTPCASYRALNELLRDAETVLQRLSLHYRITELLVNEVGFSSSKTFDLEVWLPSLKVFKEVSSCSNTEHFQATRTQTRYRADGSNKSVHMINGSGVAVGRLLVALLETHQSNAIAPTPRASSASLNKSRKGGRVV